jgi:hypothetical protein
MAGFHVQRLDDGFFTDVPGETDFGPGELDKARHAAAAYYETTNDRTRVVDHQCQTRWDSKFDIGAMERQSHEVPA